MALTNLIQKIRKRIRELKKIRWWTKSMISFKDMKRRSKIMISILSSITTRKLLLSKNKNKIHRQVELEIYLIYYLHLHSPAWINNNLPKTITQQTPLISLMILILEIQQILFNRNLKCSSNCHNKWINRLIYLIWELH